MPLEPGLRSLTLSTAHACRPCLQVTCNQGHRDIKASILDGQYPDERADIAPLARSIAVSDASADDTWPHTRADARAYARADVHADDGHAHVRADE